VRKIKEYLKEIYFPGGSGGFFGLFSTLSPIIWVYTIMIIAGLVMGVVMLLDNGGKPC